MPILFIVFYSMFINFNLYAEEINYVERTYDVPRFEPMYIQAQNRFLQKSSLKSFKKENLLFIKNNEPNDAKKQIGAELREQLRLSAYILNIYYLTEGGYDNLLKQGLRANSNFISTMAADLFVYKIAFARTEKEVQQITRYMKYSELLSIWTRAFVNPDFVSDDFIARFEGRQNFLDQVIRRTSLNFNAPQLHKGFRELIDRIQSANDKHSASEYLVKAVAENGNIEDLVDLYQFDQELTSWVIDRAIDRYLDKLGHDNLGNYDIINQVFKVNSLLNQKIRKTSEMIQSLLLYGTHKQSNSCIDLFMVSN